MLFYKNHKEQQKTSNKPFYSGNAFSLKAQTRLNQTFKMLHNVQVFKTASVDSELAKDSFAFNNFSQVFATTPQSTSTIKIGNKGALAEFQFTPKNLNIKNNFVQLGSDHFLNSQSGNLLSNFHLRYRSPVFANIRLWETVHLALNTQDTLKTLSNTVNLQIHEKYLLGFALDYDFNDLKSLEAEAAYKPNDFRYIYLRSNILSKQVTLGGQESFRNDIKGTVEIDYDVKQEKKGFMGYPVSMKVGMENQLTHSSKVNSQIELNEEILFNQVCSHRLNRNLKVSVASKSNISKILSEPSPKNYNVGVLVKWTF
ncbi:UNKNOWN [Stylonychia lemnae]|uniref:Uncharacterized protein n=1 Tax=Stylonychia lemnae TaxID=5949 RepID=A0A078A750_STYLE|nr:UNKNOWN [Stylonychia lemnae]|eukprot:CDW76616.1 UNKNOWN [Stylonychia lemnae]